MPAVVRRVEVVHALVQHRLEHGRVRGERPVQRGGAAALAAADQERRQHPGRRGDPAVRAGAEVHDPLDRRRARCVRPFISTSSSTRRTSTGSSQVPSTPSRAPGLGLPVGEVAGGQVDQVEQGGQLAAAGAGTSNGASSSPARRTVRLHRAGRVRRSAWMRRCSSWCSASKPSGTPGGEPLPVPDQQRVGRGSPCSTGAQSPCHAPYRRSVSPAALDQQLGGGGQRGALRPVGDRGQPVRAARPSTRWRPASRGEMPQQPATSQHRRGEPARRSAARAAATPAAPTGPAPACRATARRAAPAARSAGSARTWRQRGQRGRLGADQAPGQRPGAQLGEAERVARPGRAAAAPACGWPAPVRCGCSPPARGRAPRAGSRRCSRRSAR